MKRGAGRMPEAASRHETGSSARVVPLRRQTIAAQVRAVLRRDIIAGRLLPRGMLSEQELSQRFGVSRTPIREALIKLAEENLIEIYPQYGSFVAPIKLRDVFDSQFVRESLECSAIERAVERIDAAQIKALSALLQRQRVLHRAGDHDEFFRIVGRERHHDDACYTPELYGRVAHRAESLQRSSSSGGRKRTARPNSAV